MEEWISQNAYMKRFHCGHKEIQRMIENNEVEYKQSEGGHIKIKVGGNSISREVYEKEKERRIQAETTLEMLKTIINKEVKTNENY